MSLVFFNRAKGNFFVRVIGYTLVAIGLFLSLVHYFFAIEAKLVDWLQLRGGILILLGSLVVVGAIFLKEKKSIGRWAPELAVGLFFFFFGILLSYRGASNHETKARIEKDNENRLEQVRRAKEAYGDSLLPTK